MPADDDLKKQVKNASNRQQPPQNARGDHRGRSMLLRRLLWRFLGNRDAGVAPMLALAALPLFGFVGAAVDYSRAASARTAMQAALDASALMLSKDAQTLTAADLAQKADRRLQGACSTARKPTTSRSPRQFSQPAAGQLHAQADRQRHGQHRVLQAARAVAPSHLSASAEVLWGIKKLNLALVLDNTGSMAVERQDDQPEDGRAQSSHHAEERRQDAGRRQGRDRAVRHRRQCRHRQRQRHLDRLDRLGRRQRHVQQHQLHHARALASRTARSGRPTPHSTWNGCVYDRDQNNDVPTPRPSPARRRRCSAPIRPPTARPR